jgi:uncharacterized phage-associated protein
VSIYSLIACQDGQLQFNLDIRKAIEAAATLVRLSPNKMMGRKRLLALLYMADRASLEQTGRPIIGGQLNALDYGPIHSGVYDFIKGSHYKQEAWSAHYVNIQHFVKMEIDPGVGALSQYETNLLSDLSERYIAVDDWDVADVTHKFQEYKTAYAGRSNTSVIISLETVLDAVGRGNQKGRILKDAEEKNFFDQMFSSKT